MIGRSFWDIFGALSCRSWSIAQQCGDRLSIDILNYMDRVVSGAGFLAGVVLECNLAHRRSVAVLCMQLRIKSNPVHPLSDALTLPYVPSRRLGFLWLLIGTRLHLLAVELPSTVEPLCPSQCLFRTILVTLYLMVWDWRILRAEPMLSCCPNLVFIFV